MCSRGAGSGLRLLTSITTSGFVLESRMRACVRACRRPDGINCQCHLSGSMTGSRGFTTPSRSRVFGSWSSSSSSGEGCPEVLNWRVVSADAGSAPRRRSMYNQLIRGITHPCISITTFVRACGVSLFGVRLPNHQPMSREFSVMSSIGSPHG